MHTYVAYVYKTALLFIVSTDFPIRRRVKFRSRHQPFDDSRGGRERRKESLRVGQKKKNVLNSIKSVTVGLSDAEIIASRLPRSYSRNGCWNLDLPTSRPVHKWRRYGLDDNTFYHTSKGTPLMGVFIMFLQKRGISLLYY